jgi:hypothetical protein
MQMLHFNGPCSPRLAERVIAVLWQSGCYNSACTKFESLQSSAAAKPPVILPAHSTVQDGLMVRENRGTEHLELSVWTNSSTGDMWEIEYYDSPSSGKDLMCDVRQCGVGLWELSTATATLLWNASSQLP